MKAEPTPPTVRGATLIVARLVVVVWLGELARQTKADRRTIRSLAWLAVLGLVLWQGLGVIGRLQSVPIGAVSSRLQIQLASELITAGVAIPSLLTAIVLVLTPEKSIVDTFLAPLPVSDKARRLGSAVPLLSLAVAISVLILCPIAVTSAPLLDAALLAPFLVGLSGSVLFGTAFSGLLFGLARRVASSRVRVPAPLARFAAAVAVVALAVILVISRPSPQQDLSPLEAWFVSLTLCVVGLIVAIVAGRLPAEPCNAVTTPVRLFMKSAAKSRNRSLHTIELRRWYRSPLLLTVDALSLVSTIALVLLVPTKSPSWSVLATGMLIAASSGAPLLAHGLSRRTDWIYQASPTTSLRRSLVRLQCAAISTVGPIAVAVVALTIAGHLGKATVLTSVSSVLVAFASSYLAGALLPIDEKVGVSSLGTLALALALDAGVALGVPHLGADFAVAASGGIAVAFTVLAVRWTAKPAASP